jgi:hypothetical protein
MIVKDLLEQCSKEDVARVFLDLVAKSSIEPKAPGLDLMPGCLEMIDRITAIAPVAEKGALLLGGYFTQDGKEKPEIFVIYKETLINFDSNTAWSRIESIDNLSDEEIEQFIKLAALPETYTCELTPWNEILGYEVNPENIAAVGSVAFAATILYKMTFLGFSEEDVDQERQKLHESFAEQEAILNLPPEERKKYVHSAEEVFARFGLRDERTEEEKARQRREMYREVIENDLRKFRMIKRYALS